MNLNEAPWNWTEDDLPNSVKVDNGTSDFLQQELNFVKSNGKFDPNLTREAGRVQRSRLSSADGTACEVHDQFYRDHKLLLVLFRALAVMPITRSSPGKYLLILSLCSSVSS